MSIIELFLSESDKPEVKNLEKISLYIFVFLSIIIILGSLILTFTIEGKWVVTSAAFAGIIGSSTASLLSALSRRANGWELSNGSKIPEQKSEEGTKKERFSLSMAPFFCFRPFLGIIAGLIVFYGGDLLGLKLDSPTDSVVVSETKLALLQDETFKRIIFFSLLSGLFAKTLIEILKGMFKSFFGRG